jgi:hypothetical protein
VFGFLQMRKNNFKTAGAVIVLTLIYHFTFGQIIDKKCAFHYYSVFHNQSVAEGYIVRPIEEAGKEIGPILTEKINDKEMKSRRYAILGLQKIDYQPATELMGQILFDKSEFEVYRADAYETLKRFDSEISNKLIREFRHQAKDSIENKVVELGEYFYDNRDK